MENKEEKNLKKIDDEIDSLEDVSVHREKYKFPPDMKSTDKKEIKQYIYNRLPYLSKITDDLIIQWFQLYMNGKTYAEIARMTKSRLAIILFLAYKHNWYEKKMKHYNDLLDNLTNKLTEAKLSSANTLTTIISACGHYLDNHFNNYLKNKDTKALSKIDNKILTQYYKAIDTLEKLTAKPKKAPKQQNNTSGGGVVNINLNGNAKIKSKEKVINITEDNAGDILLAMASAQKEIDKDKK